MSTEVQTPTSIEDFRGDYSFLSNFYLIPVEYEGVQYMSVEHAFQAAKTLVPHERARIRDAQTPAMAKRLGRQATKRPDWEEPGPDGIPLRVKVMKELLRHKAARPVIAALLLRTDPAVLVEGNTWHDQYWGSCTCPMHRNTPGENMLGKLWMEVRREIA